MKTKLTYLAALVMLGSCAGESTKETSQEAATNEEKKEVCSYAFDPTAKSEILWVSYKYTEKTGVKGLFDEFEVSGTGSGATAAEVLMGAQVNINTASVNSGDATRDPKIKESFFGSLTDGSQITGKIASVDEASKAVTIDVGMNGAVETVTGSYSLNENHLEIKFEMNVANWGAQGGIDALNKVCEDLHKGADGKSILWPDVTVFVSTDLSKTCE